MSPQLVMNFELRPGLEVEDFLVADCNRDAVAWIDRWPNWPSPTLFLHGPAGSGKSHLAQVFVAKTKAVTITAEELLEKDPRILLADAGACLLDDMDQAFVEKDHGGLEVALLHLYNIAAEAGISIMMTGRTPPSRWSLQLADLSSRLKTASVVNIKPPDDALLAGVLVKQFADRQLRIDNDVVAFVQIRIERSFVALGQLVEAADRLALAEKRRITVPLVRRVLRELNPD